MTAHTGPNSHRHPITDAVLVLAGVLIGLGLMYAEFLFIPYNRSFQLAPIFVIIAGVVLILLTTHPGQHTSGQAPSA